ncbi:DUF4124 domain-containing protein [Metapseudomonas otitidis]|uniref:DUF4124 domain-containing protein n=1 Tax=Metapseudomonas otitidis TaxID=319939 RepID=UPI003EDF1617
MRHLLFCLLACSSLASAEIYRWTDANGQVHFSEQPREGAQQVEVRPPALDDDAPTRERLQRTEQFFDARRQEKEEARRKEIQARNERASQCVQLRSQLSQIKREGKYFSVDAKGERQYYSAEQVDAARRKLTDAIKERCGR